MIGLLLVPPLICSTPATPCDRGRGCGGGVVAMAGGRSPGGAADHPRAPPPAPGLAGRPGGNPPPRPLLPGTGGVDAGAGGEGLAVAGADCRGAAEEHRRGLRLRGWRGGGNYFRIYFKKKILKEGREAAPGSTSGRNPSRWDHPPDSQRGTTAHHTRNQGWARMGPLFFEIVSPGPADSVSLGWWPHSHWTLIRTRRSSWPM